MKLDAACGTWTRGAAFALIAAASSACASGSAAPASRTATATTITSADALVAGSTPRVGKIQRIVGDEVGGGGGAPVTTNDDESFGESAPKEPRRSDAKHRGGSFGSIK